MLGLVLVSHSGKLVIGLSELLQEIAKDIHLTVVGGLEDGLIGTTFDRIFEAVESNEADEVIVLYDLGSAKMNVEMVQESTSKVMHIRSVALVEGAFVVATLLQANVSLDVIDKQLKELIIKK